MLDTKAIIVVGRPRTGKTTWTKKAVAAIGRPYLAWDIAAQWGQTAPDEEKFVEEVKRRRRCTIVWEEAVTFIDSPNSKVSREVAKIISRRRHSETTHFLLFTSLRSVPTRIMENCDRIIIFKTNDNPALIAQKFRGWPEVLEGFERQRNRVSNFEPVDVHIFGA